LLRGELGFDGIICTDWGLVTDTTILGQPMPARAWGAEHLDELSRVEMILNAGCDQFGGEARPELVVQLVEQGRIAEERIDVSVPAIAGEVHPRTVRRPVVFGVAQPEGSLPFDLPRSMAAVEASRSDVPFDTADPVFRFGHGLRYTNSSGDH
jgi:hypothetical protein